MNVDAISQLLWQLDPMNTCCNVNEGMEDEYWSQASDIAERLEQGETPRAAIIATFDFWFWEDCLLSDERLPLLEQMVSALAETPFQNAQPHSAAS